MKNINKLFKNGAFNKIKGQFSSKVFQNKKFFNTLKNRTFNLKALGVATVMIGGITYMNKDVFLLEAATLPVQSANTTQIVVQSENTQSTQQHGKEIDITVHKPAGLGPRVVAAIVDGVFALSITAVSVFVSFKFFPLSVIIVFPISLVISVFTMVFSDALTYDEDLKVHRSVGKRMMGIVPYRWSTSQPCSYVELFVHSTITSVVTQFTFLPDLLLLVLTEDKRTIADRVLGLYFAIERN